MKQKNCVVTGAAGFIGANLVNELLKRNYKVHILVKDTSSLWRIKDKKNNKNLKIYYSNLTSKKELTSIFHRIKPIKIFHLASYGNYSYDMNFKRMANTNIQATINILEASKEINYKSLIITGTSSEYGFKKRPMEETDNIEPNSYYAVTKASSTLLASTYAKINHKPIKILRLFSVYGPYEEPTRLVPTLISSTLNNQTIHLTKGKIRRDFVYIDDVINAIITASNKNDSSLNGEIFNIGSGVQYDNNDIVNTIKKISKKEPNIEFNFKTRDWDTNYWVANIQKSKRLLKWEPKYSIENGLRKSYIWYKNNNNNSYNFHE